MQQNAGTLAIAGATAAASTLTFKLAGGNVAGPGTLTVNGAANWTSAAQLGTVANPMTTVIASGRHSTISGSTIHPVGPNSTLRINGTATWTGPQHQHARRHRDRDRGAERQARRAERRHARRREPQDHRPVARARQGTLTKSGGTGTTAVECTGDERGHAGRGSGTLTLNGLGTPLSNYNAATKTLTGGALPRARRGDLRFAGADVLTNAAEITLDGAGSDSPLTARRRHEQPVHDHRRWSAPTAQRQELRTHGGTPFTNSGELALGKSTNFTLTGVGMAYTRRRAGSSAPRSRAPGSASSPHLQ